VTDVPVATRATARPPLRRDPANKVVAGVCAGAARTLGVDPLMLRVVTVIASVATGLGVPVYLFAWVMMPSSSGAPALAARFRGRAGSWQIAAGVACLTLAALLTARGLGLWWNDAIVWPFALAASGGALVWRQSQSKSDDVPAAAPPQPREEQRQELRSGRERAVRDVRRVYQGGFGVALVVGAGLLFLQANGALTAARDVVLAAVVVTLGLGLVLAPFWLRLVRGLDAERGERIRSQERAEVAAHLHDSVLQTLALVQKRADDPRAVATLARRQERELRAWLSDAGEARPDERLADALQATAAAVEEQFGTPVEVVAVGDRPLDDRHRALVAAAREALLNAARHGGGAAPIVLYLEVADGRTEVFVRDRGRGFDPAAVPGDRRGVRESIVGRMARHGGRAAVHSRPGEGTEVELVIDD
jgi:signal transduction histidine kinase/phage shock protein PspC (stress-responsive transcriptional regulator)